MEIKIYIIDGAMFVLVAWAIAFAIVGFAWDAANYHPFG